MTAFLDATKSHVRPAALDAVPRVGFLNLMPLAEEFEGMLLPQFAAAAPFDPVWLKMRGRRYRNDDRARIDGRYVLMADAGELDAVVVTGAAVEHVPFREVRYLGEVADVVRRACVRRLPILGLCWGALAVGHLLLGLDHQTYQRKVSGAYPTDLLHGDSVFGKGQDDRFWTAHSRFAGFDESSVAAAVDAGTVRVIGRAPDPAGTIIAESADHNVLMHIGHPEYAGPRLAFEYRRDVAAGLPDVHPPANVDLDDPVCQWRSHSRMFFANWIEHVYATALVRARGVATRLEGP